MRLAAVLACLLILPTIGMSKTIHVPKDHAKIQDAIDAAVGGDTVLVAPGTYVENIDFKGKAITVMSDQGPDVTTIDGNQLMSVVSFKSGEGADSILDGFEIKNGKDAKGGGIVVIASSPTIKNNYIVENTASDGGGVYHDGYNDTLVLENNKISDNFADYGGGVYCSAKTLISGNTISDNWTGWGFGGGICCFSSSIQVIGNVICRNNTSRGGGIYCDSGVVTSTNNIYFDNNAGDGSAIQLYVMAWANITNDTYYGESINIWIDSSASITNSILWNTSMWIGDFDSPSGAHVKHSNANKSWIHVEPDCYLVWEEGNIYQDPRFVDPGAEDFHLSWTSPCINRGTNGGAPADDFDGDPRPCMGTVDMGADEFVGMHPLGADVFSLSESTGGMVSFSLNGQPENANRQYLVVGSVSGTAPGTVLPKGMAVLPLNWDLFTDFVIAYLNSAIFINFMGVLDPTGSGVAFFNTNGPMPPGTAGITLSFAYALNKPWDFVSNPVNVEMVP